MFASPEQAIPIDPTWSNHHKTQAAVTHVPVGELFTTRGLLEVSGLGDLSPTHSKKTLEKMTRCVRHLGKTEGVHQFERMTDPRFGDNNTLCLECPCNKSGSTGCKIEQDRPRTTLIKISL